MSILYWILLGLVAGTLGKFLMPGAEGGIVKTIILGIIGAVVGGYLAGFFGFGSVTGFDVRSLVVATVGAMAVIWAARFLTK